MRKIFEAADAQPDADDICFVSDGCTALQIAALYPPLTEQEEQELLSTRGTPGWESARERLVLCNLRLVMWVANRYPESGGFTTEDLIEYGIVGLMLGIDRYQASQETKLSTYVIPWIQKTIREQVMLRQGLITVPAHMAGPGGQVAKRTAPNDRGRHPGTVHGRADDQERNRSVHVGTAAIRHGSVHVRVFGYAGGIRQFTRFIRYRNNGRRFYCRPEKEYRRNGSGRCHGGRYPALHGVLCGFRTACCPSPSWNRRRGAENLPGMR